MATDSRKGAQNLSNGVHLRIPQPHDELLRGPIAPIHAIPLELIRHIVSFVVSSPHDIPQIVALSAISRFWRSAVLSIPQLFIAPRWNWPTVVFDLWRERAGERSLSTKIDFSKRSEEWSKTYHNWMKWANEFLERESGHIQTLEVFLCDPNPDAKGVLYPLPYEFGPLDSSGIKDRFRSLRSLTIIGFTTESFSVKIDLSIMPLLETIHVLDNRVKIEGQGSSLRQVGLPAHLPLELRAALQVLFGRSNTSPPSHLSLYTRRWSFFYTDREWSAKFPPRDLRSLQSLQLCNFYKRHSQFAQLLVPKLVAPCLSVLELVQSDLETSKVVIKSLSPETAAAIKMLVLDLRGVFPKTLRQIIQLLSSPIPTTLSGPPTTPPRLPNLQSLVIVPNQDWSELQKYVFDLNQMEHFFRERGRHLQTLVLPRKPDLDAEKEGRWHNISEGINISYSWMPDEHGLASQYIWCSQS